MKKIACIAMIIGLVIGSLQIFQGEAEAHTGALFPDYVEWQIFEGAGNAVEIPAGISSLICGTATALVGGIPLSGAGYILGLPFKKSNEFAGKSMTFCGTLGSVIGQLAVGTPVLITKAVFYDTPKVLLNPETYKITDK